MIFHVAAHVAVLILALLIVLRRHACVLMRISMCPPRKIFLGYMYVYVYM